MTSQTQGIQQLLAAEKIAAEKVTDARKRKAKRLKQAKDEAQDEIEKYRVRREKQFREYEVKYMGSREDIAAKIDSEAEGRLNQMEIDVVANKGKVIEEILKLVCDIEPEVHRNYRPPRVEDN